MKKLKQHLGRSCSRWLLSLIFLLPLCAVNSWAYTVYCTNDKNWSTIDAYVWNGSTNQKAWPGEAMTKSGKCYQNGTSLSYVWEYTFTPSFTPANIIFNNNNAGSQTNDLTYTDGALYQITGSSNKYDATTISNPTIVGPYFLHYSEGAGNWKFNYPMTADESTYTYTLTTTNETTYIAFTKGIFTNTSSWTGHITRYTAGSKDLSATSGTELALGTSGDNCWTIGPGEWIISANFSTSKVTFTKKVVELDYYVIYGTGGGSESTWSKSDANKMTKNSDGTYSFTLASVDLDTEFKVASSDEKYYTCSTGTEDKYWVSSNITDVAANTTNASMIFKTNDSSVASFKDVTITFNPTTPSISVTLTAVQKEVTAYMALKLSNYNDWDYNAANTKVGADGYYTFNFTTTSGNGNYVIFSKDVALTSSTWDNNSNLYGTTADKNVGNNQTETLTSGAKACFQPMAVGNWTAKVKADFSEVTFSYTTTSVDYYVINTTNWNKVAATKMTLGNDGCYYYTFNTVGANTEFKVAGSDNTYYSYCSGGSFYEYDINAVKSESDPWTIDVANTDNGSPMKFTQAFSNVTVKFDVTNKKVYVYMSSSPLYIAFDQGSGWSFNNQMSYASGKYTYNLTTSGTTYVTFCTGVIDSNWTVPSGATRYGAGDAEVNVTSGTAYTMTASTDKCWVLPKGKWSVSVTLNDTVQTVTFTEVSSANYVYVNLGADYMNSQQGWKKGVYPQLQYTKDGSDVRVTMELVPGEECIFRAEVPAEYTSRNSSTTDHNGNDGLFEIYNPNDNNADVNPKKLWCWFDGNTTEYVYGTDNNVVYQSYITWDDFVAQRAAPKTAIYLIGKNMGTDMKDWDWSTIKTAEKDEAVYLAKFDNGTESQTVKFKMSWIDAKTLGENKEDDGDNHCKWATFNLGILGCDDTSIVEYGDNDNNGHVNYVLGRTYAYNNWSQFDWQFQSDTTNDFYVVVDTYYTNTAIVTFNPQPKLEVTLGETANVYNIPTTESDQPNTSAVVYRAARNSGEVRFDQVNQISAIGTLTPTEGSTAFGTTSGYHVRYDVMLNDQVLGYIYNPSQQKIQIANLVPQSAEDDSKVKVRATYFTKVTESPENDWQGDLGSDWNTAFRTRTVDATFNSSTPLPTPEVKITKYGLYTANAAPNADGKFTFDAYLELEFNSVKTDANNNNVTNNYYWLPDFVLSINSNDYDYSIDNYMVATQTWANSVGDGTAGSGSVQGAPSYMEYTPFTSGSGTYADNNNWAKKSIDSTTGKATLKVVYKNAITTDDFANANVTLNARVAAVYPFLVSSSEQTLEAQTASPVKRREATAYNGSMSDLNIVTARAYAVASETLAVSNYTTGVEDIMVDVDGAVEYYNLNGIRVNADDLTPGIYIRRQGNTTTKVLVK